MGTPPITHRARVHFWPEDGLLRDLGLSVGSGEELAARLPQCLVRYEEETN